MFQHICEGEFYTKDLSGVCSADSGQSMCVRREKRYFKESCNRLLFFRVLIENIYLII